MEKSDSQDMLKQQIKRMQENKLKTPMEILDDIFTRQRLRVSEEYQAIKSLKGVRVKKSSHQEEKIQNLEDTINASFLKEQDFNSMGYFAYTSLSDPSVQLREDKVNFEKLKGRFNVRIKQELPWPLKIRQLGNEKLSFHLHKRRDFFERLQQRKSVGERRREKDERELEEIRELYGQKFRNKGETRNASLSHSTMEPLSLFELNRQSINSTMDNFKGRNKGRDRYKTSESPKFPSIAKKNQSIDVKQADQQQLNRSLEFVTPAKETDFESPNINSQKNYKLLPHSFHTINEYNTDSEVNDHNDASNPKKKKVVIVDLKEETEVNHSLETLKVDPQVEMTPQKSLNPLRSLLKRINDTSSQTISTEDHTHQPGSFQTLPPVQPDPTAKPKNLFQQKVQQIMLAKQFYTDPKVNWDIRKDQIKKHLQKLQVQCEGMNKISQEKLREIARRQLKENLRKQKMDFTLNVLQEFDTVETYGLDIIFEYKVQDEEYQKQEANKIAKEFKLRNMDPVQMKIEKMQLKNEAAKRRKVKN